ncbi:MAG: ATP-binding protein [Candidatus Methanoplasma sp.]|jgi:predicted AAA+ superfamily ATPase|nr:ATP-binding protein [Candidatus Methanoplasma sp.]
MLKRKMMDHLITWKREKNKECLLIKGARQVGKTFIIREFAKQNYENVVEINFLTEPKFKEAFKGSLNMDEIIRKISIYDKKANFVEGKTLLFLDEIQECGDARTALKPIAEDNRFDCIASGSMLGIAFKTTRSIPVGYERQVEMFSLDFEEFLWATGYDDARIGYIREYFEKKEQVPAPINEVFLEKLREYAVVGGMPSVVSSFVETNNFGKVHSEQERIISSYLDDIAKYAPPADKPKARDCYISIPTQLAKENKKFQYSVVEKEASAKKFESSLEWLRDAGLIKFCYNVETPRFPLPAYNQTGYFKVYLTDIGLLNAMYGFDMKAEIYGNTLKGPAKGGIYENLIADILLKKGIKLNYYKPGENKQEIEFLLTKKGEVIPLEVKAKNGRTRSLDEFMRRFDPPYALKLVTGNVGVDGKKLTVPHYMAMFL